MSVCDITVYLDFMGDVSGGVCVCISLLVNNSWLICHHDDFAMEGC